MSLLRRQFLQLSACTALAPALPSISFAQAYPTRPLRLMVGFAAGNAPDIIARLVADRLTARLGQQIVVENRVGAGSTLAAQAVASAAPDGYTLLQITPANAINPNLGQLGTFIDQIEPVTRVARGAFVILVNPTFPAKTLPELISYARGNPDGVLIGTSLPGTAPHLSAALFKMMTGLDLVLVPFRGSTQAITELLGGRVHLVFADMAAFEFIRSGQVRALAVTTTERQSTLPDVPPAAESIPGYEASTWYGIGVAKGTPGEITDRLDKEIIAGVSESKVKERLVAMGFTVDTGSRADFGKLIAEETKKWAKVKAFATQKK